MPRMTTKTRAAIPDLGTVGDPLCCEILETQPNPMFTKEQRDWIRFLRYNRRVPCAECGKLDYLLWTMLCEFRAPTLGPGVFTITSDNGTVHAPLTGVCEDHPLAIAWPAKQMRTQK